MGAQVWHERRYLVQLDVKYGWASCRCAPKADLRSRSRPECDNPTRILAVDEEPLRREIHFLLACQSRDHHAPSRGRILKPQAGSSGLIEFEKTPNRAAAFQHCCLARVWKRVVSRCYVSVRFLSNFCDESVKRVADEAGRFSTTP